MIADGGRRLRLLVGGLALVAGGVGLFAYLDGRAAEREEAARRARAAQAWADAQQCLLGARLAEVPVPAAQVRRIELAGNDPRAADGWPRACATHLTELYQALDDQAFAPSLRRELRERFGCADGCASAEPATQLVGLAEVVLEAGLATVPPRVAAPSMVTTSLFTKDEVGQLAPVDARIQSRDYLSDGRARYLFQSEGRGLSFCELAPDSAEGRRCAALALPIPPSSAELVRGAPELLVRARTDGLEVPRHFDGRGAAVAATPGLRLSRREGRRVAVEASSAGAVVEVTELELPEGASRPILVDGAVFFAVPDGNGALELRALVVKTTDKGGPHRATPVVLGETAGVHEPPEVCTSAEGSALLFGRTLASWEVVLRRGDALVGPLVVKRGEAPEPPSPSPAAPRAAPSGEPRGGETPTPAPSGAAPPAHVAAKKKAAQFGMIELLEEANDGEASSRWRGGDARKREKPSDARDQALWTEALGPTEPPLRRPLPRHALSCRDGGATIVWRSPDAAANAQRIHRVRCEGGGCKHEQLVLTGLTVKTWWTAASLSHEGKERVLLVWQDERGILLRRIASFEELASADDAMVMDNAEHGGLATDDLEAVFGDAAVVFLFRGNGFHALAFHADGRVQPL